MNKDEERVDLSSLREVLPQWVARNWKGWTQNIPISPRTLANLDSQKKSVKNRILIGNVVAYERNSLIEFLESRSRIIS